MGSLRVIQFILLTTVYFLFAVNRICDLKTIDKSEAEDDYEYMEYYDYHDDFEKSPCDDDIAEENCTHVLAIGKCGDRQDMNAMLCRKTCGYCNQSSGSATSKSLSEDLEDSSETEEYSTVSTPRQLDDERKECEDKLPTCSASANNQFCCSMKQTMNYSCEKSCKFCSQTQPLPNPGVAGSGMMPTPVAPTATTNQDPCVNNEGKPPGVAVDTPGPSYGATTTTTESAIPPAFSTYSPVPSYPTSFVRAVQD